MSTRGSITLGDVWEQGDDPRRDAAAVSTIGLEQTDDLSSEIR